MAEYKGTFTVTNNTGVAIDNVIVTHYTTDFGANTFGPAPLPNANPSAQTALLTSTTNKDRWSVAFTMQGRLFTGQENCGFESSDAGGNVSIVLDKESFDIDMPASSSCTDNDYSET